MTWGVKLQQMLKQGNMLKKYVSGRLIEKWASDGGSFGIVVLQCNVKI